MTAPMTTIDRTAGTMPDCGEAVCGQAAEQQEHDEADRRRRRARAARYCRWRRRTSQPSIPPSRRRSRMIATTVCALPAIDVTAAMPTAIHSDGQQGAQQRADDEEHGLDALDEERRAGVAERVEGALKHEQHAEQARGPSMKASSTLPIAGDVREAARRTRAANGKATTASATAAKTMQQPDRAQRRGEVVAQRRRGRPSLACPLIRVK